MDIQNSHQDLLGNKLVSSLVGEIADEFPSLDEVPEIIKERHYESINDDYWK